MFFGRKIELEMLSAFYTDKHAKCACIYGRAGMGKTALLRHFAEDKKSIYFNAYATTGIRETTLFAKACGCNKKMFSEDQKATEQLSIILNDIQEKAELEDAPVVLIMDNYPLFARADSGFDKLFHDFVVNSNNLKVLFSGDSYLTMSKVFWEKKSIWKNALYFCYELTALGFYESSEFVSHIEDPAARAAVYGVTGGIPAGLEQAGSNYNESVENIFFKNKESAYIPEHTMQTELRELSYYNHILTVLAQGYNRVNQISKCVNKPKDVVVPYMNTLMSIGMVTKENPVTEKTNRKKTRYSIVNTYDLFWYRFFAPFIDKYFDGDYSGMMEASINPGFDAFMETVFISMCKEYLERCSANGKLPFNISEIGNWWQNDDEKQTTQGFDLVAVGESGGDEAMIFGRCYYTDEPVVITTLKELIDLTKQVKGKKNVFYLVFSKSGFHENTTTVAATIKNIILVSLKDIVNG